MFEFVLFVIQQVCGFICPMKIFHEIKEMEQPSSREDWEIWADI